jgi:capsule polysaccharide export protein KpsC/LpsZ
MTNNELVMIAAQENPEAEILYKPHPDVLNNLRRRLSDPADVRHVCQVIEQDVTLPQALDTVDHVYSITSLGGFEALLRGIPVTTMGCPFYAGWGVTDDRQPNPRRTRRLTVEQIFAGAYILYPRYFDPLRRTPLRIEDALELLDRMRQQRDEAARLEPPVASPPATPGHRVPEAGERFPQLAALAEELSRLLRAANATAAPPADERRELPG